MNEDSRIFVAGGTGLVGSAILRTLVLKGFSKITASFHQRQPTYLPSFAANLSSINWIPIDLTRQAEVESLFERERPEYVMLAAAKVGGILANSTYTAEFIYQNIMIAANVIHASYKYGVKKLLNLGSSCIYPRNAPQPLKEEYLLTGELEPTNEPYAVAKIAAIKLCRYYNHQYGTDFMSVMPTNLYGPGDNFDLETSHVLPALIRKMHLAKLLEEENFNLLRKDFITYGNGRVVRDGIEFQITGSADRETILAVLDHFGIKMSRHPRKTPLVEITLWGSGTPYREFMYVDDLASAVVFLVENHSSAETGEFINIGTGDDISISDLAGIIKKIVGFNGDILFNSTMPDGMARKRLEMGRMKNLGWKAGTGLYQGITQTYKSYLDILTGGKHEFRG